jgi:hypothetical protein
LQTQPLRKNMRISCGDTRHQTVFAVARARQQTVFTVARARHQTVFAVARARHQTVCTVARARHQTVRTAARARLQTDAADASGSFGCAASFFMSQFRCRYSSLDEPCLNDHAEITPAFGVFSMLRAHIVGLIVLAVGGSLLVAGDDAKLTSGPKVGASMPGSFECFNVNGPAKGRPHCLVCKFGLNASLILFAKEPAEGKDDALNDLLKKLDATVTDFEERTFSVGVVFLSPDARDSTNNAGAVTAEDIIKEAVQREKLVERLKKRAEPLKNVIVAYYPLEGPKSYQINPKAEITGLYYENFKVVNNFVFAPGAMQTEDVDALVKQVREALARKKG